MNILQNIFSTENTMNYDVTCSVLSTVCGVEFVPQTSFYKVSTTLIVWIKILTSLLKNRGNKWSYEIKKKQKPFTIWPKGQLILKRFFEVVDFLQKTIKNKSHTSKNEFFRSFFGGNWWPQKPFRNYLTFKAMSLILFP